MAAYTVINELQSIEFNDSLLESVCMEGTRLRMVFSDAIIIGHSCLDIEGRVPCSVNSGADRYACPVLTLTLEGVQIRFILRGGCWSKDAQGNTIEDYPPRKLTPEEYGGFAQMVPAGGSNLVYGLSYDAEIGAYTISFFMDADPQYYEIEFTAETAIAEFEEFGRDAWYLARRWEKPTENS